MRKLLNALLLLLLAGQLFAQNPIRLKYSLLFQSSNNTLNTFPTDSTVASYPTLWSTWADEHMNFGKTLLNEPYDSTSKTIYSYDQNGNVIREVRMRRIGGGPWENFFKHERLFDASGKLLDYSFFSWMNGLWKEIRFSTRGYNVAGLETLRIDKDTVAGILTNRDFYATTYDTLNRITYYSWQKWVNGNWQFYIDEVYHYKSNTSRLDSVEHKYWDTNSFKKSGRTLFFYNNQGQLVQQVRQQLQSGTYTNSTMLEFGYDNFGTKNASVFFTWDIPNNSWRPSSGDYYIFDTQGRTTEYVTNQVDNTTNQLKNTWRTQTTFAPDSSIITQTSAGWANDEWVVFSKSEWIFEPTGVNSTERISDYNATAYPNPFTNQTTIYFDAVPPADANTRVFDIHGRIVHFVKPADISSNAYLWNAKDQNGNTLPNGMYFLNLSTGSYQQHFKLIKH